MNRTAKWNIVGLACGFVLLGVVMTTADDKPTDPAAQKIRQALEGDESVKPTGDGVLDDVIQIIKRQGSVLDGSSLDEDQPSKRVVADPVDRRALVAEQLLKSARMLSVLEQPDDDRRKLIRRMRSEAASLLTE